MNTGGATKAASLDLRLFAFKPRHGYVDTAALAPYEVIKPILGAFENKTFVYVNRLKRDCLLGPKKLFIDKHQKFIGLTTAPIRKSKFSFF